MSRQFIQNARENKELFKALTEHSLDIISIIAADGTILFESKATERLLGYSPDQRVGENVFKFVHPEDLAYVKEEFTKREETVKTLEFRFRSQEGSWVWLEATGQNFLDDPQINGILVNSRDITKRKEAEIALKASETKYHHLIETAHDAIYLMSETGRIIDTNETACGMLGKSKQEILQSFIGEIDPNFTTESFLAFWAEVPFFEQQVFETTHVKKDGTKFPVEVSGKKCVLSEQVCYYGIARDITERKKTENELKEKEKRFRALFEQSAAGIALVGKQEKILEANQKFCDLLGYSRDEMVQLTVSDITVPEDKQREAAITRDIFQGKTDSFNIEKRFIHKQGHYIWANVSSRGIHDKSGNIAFSIGVVVDISRQKQAEQALKESERTYRNIVENIGEGIVNVDTHERITFASVNAGGIFGIDHKQLVNHSLKEFFPTGSFKIIEKETEGRRKGQKSSYELELHQPGGKIIPVLITATPDFDEAGNYCGAFGLISDISEIKQTREALKEREKALKTVIEHIPFAVFAHNLNGAIVFVNKTATQYSGYTKPELLQMQVSAIDHERISRDDRGKIWEKLHFGGSQQLFSRHHRKDGSTYPAEINITGITLNNEPIILAIAQDITERKKAQHALKESEEKFRLLVQNSSSVVRLTDEAFRINYVNPAHAKTYDIADEQILGLFIWDFIFMYGPVRQIKKITPKTIKEWITDFAGDAGKESIGPMEIRLKTSSGKIKYFTETVFKIKTRNGIRLGAITTDITMLKEQELKLEELNATKNKFFSVISHDLRNPIGSILGFSDLLIRKQDEYGPEKKKAYVQRIHGLTQKTFNLLDDLLLWAKSESNNLPFHPGKVNLERLAREIIAEKQDAATEKSITLDAQHVKPISLYADDRMLQMILRNLLANAIKFTHENGRVEIYSETEGNMARITVSDNGVGIPPEDQEKLWDLSESYSTNGTSGEKGTGLGLILCREFVEKHNGEIAVKSSPGKGSDFYFTIPLTTQ